MRSKGPTIDFYHNKQSSPEEGKETLPDVEVVEQIKEKWKQLRPNPPLTIQYISMVRVLEQESRRPNKKTKKQKKLEWEQRYAHADDLEIKQIEIIKPIVVPDKTQDSKKDHNKPKIKGPPQ